MSEDTPPKAKRPYNRKAKVEAAQEVQPQSVHEAITAGQETTQKAIQELAQSCAQLLLIATYLAALAVSQSAVGMTTKEADAIASPLARIFAKTDLYRKYGRTLTESHDYVALAWAMYMYLQRVITKWERKSDFGKEITPGNPGGNTGGREPANDQHGQPNHSINTNPFAPIPSPKSGPGTPFFGWRRD